MTVDMWQPLAGPGRPAVAIRDEMAEVLAKAETETTETKLVRVHGGRLDHTVRQERPGRWRMACGTLPVSQHDFERSLCGTPAWPATARCASPPTRPPPPCGPHRDRAAPPGRGPAAAPGSEPRLNAALEAAHAYEGSPRHDVDRTRHQRGRRPGRPPPAPRRAGHRLRRRRADLGLGRPQAHQRRPRNSRNARASRWRSYAEWCAIYDWAEDEPNAVLSYLSDLGDRGHPATSIEAHFSTLRAMRAIQGVPLSDPEIKACRLVIRHRAGEEADDPLVEPGPLQADPVDLDELRLMVRTLDRTTVRGKRDAAVLLIAWWMAARASEPARLNLHDAKITTVKIEDEDGRKKTCQALIIKIRRSKADQAARGQEVRILAPADQELCPIHALREWLDVLADDGQLTPGPLLRRIDRHGNIGAKAAGRPPRTIAAARHHRRHRQRHRQGRRPRRRTHPDTHPHELAAAPGSRKRRTRPPRRHPPPKTPTPSSRPGAPPGAQPVPPSGASPRTASGAAGSSRPWQPATRPRRSPCTRGTRCAAPPSTPTAARRSPGENPTRFLGLAA
ncbi:hypothetical protein O1L60_46580 [Streptomyces diastatochromogenes]|nr:hypothetical protein [Streptomyces diastatochromogenes]